MDRTREEAEIAIEALQKSKGTDGRFPPGRVNAAADFLGISTASAYRWAEYGVPDGTRSAYELSRRAEEVFARSHGRMRTAYRRLKEEGEWANAENPPGLSTFERSVKRTFSVSEIAYFREGEPARIRLSLYLKGAPTERNSVWQCDTVDLDMVALVKPNGTVRRRIKLTLLMEDSCNAIMGWSMSFSEDKASILTAVASALSVRDGCGPFGGIPDLVLVDNQLSKTSNAIKDSAALVGFSHVALEKYAPWLKGKIEALVKWINLDFSSQFPHYTKGQQNADGTPKTSRYKPPSIALVAHEFEAWVKRYNESHPIQRNGNLTPRQRWDEQADVPIRPIEPKVARALLLERKPKKVGKQGIKHDKRFYVHPDIADKVGQQVEIAWLPRDYRFVQVYQEGNWICQAKLDDAQTPEEEEAVREANTAEGKRLRKLANDLIKDGKDDIAPITGGGEQAVNTKVMSRKEAAKKTRFEPTSHQEDRNSNRRRAARIRRESERRKRDGEH